MGGARRNEKEGGVSEVFIRLAGRLLINVASLNAQGGAGTNYVEITKVPVVLKGENEKLVVKEVPAISGNMMKHFHFVNFVDLLRGSQYNSKKLLEDDLRYVAYRFKEKIQNEKNIGEEEVDLKDEADIIAKLAVADVHGYLAPGTQNRRESLVKFSFVIPCEETIKEALDVTAVTQNRVVVDEKGNILAKMEGGTEEGKAMMIFKRQYASALYGFASTFDAYYVGRPLSNPNKIAVKNIEERKERVKLAILAYINLLGGRFGANTSRGLPAINVNELIAVVSKKPVPMAKHGFYHDYIDETIRIIKDYAEAFNVNVDVFVYPKKDVGKVSNKVTITECETYVKLLQEVAKKVEDYMFAESKQED